MLPDRTCHAVSGGPPHLPGPMRVKELSERDRRWLLVHFLELGDEDRKLRFGAAISDEVITRYVQRLDFARDAVFGVYERDQVLAGVGHLVFVPRQALPLLRQATHKTMVAEFGISVAPGARGLGIGGKLFERAAVHCRNRDVDLLAMPCLASNPTMMHLARQAGMEIHCEYGEANAFLRLKSADVSAEMTVPSLDYTFKTADAQQRERWRRFPRGR